MSSASSRVVSTTSTSFFPSRHICGRSISSFFAVHGIMATQKIRSGGICIFCAQYVLMMGPIIIMGDLHVDRFFPNWGYFFSTRLTQPGQQLVNMGKGPPALTRSSSSLPSSMIVRSAVKLVSNTYLNPAARLAATSFPVPIVPGAAPKHSAIATRHAGAV